MKKARAFEFGDLTILLGLDRTESADRADIEAIDDILTRRRTVNSNSMTDHRCPQRPALRLVPDPSP